MQENEAGVTYTGNWNNIVSFNMEDVSSGFVKRFWNMIEDNEITKYPSSSAWTSVLNTDASEGTYRYAGGAPYDVYQNEGNDNEDPVTGTSRIKYTGGATDWKNYEVGTQGQPGYQNYDLNHGQPEVFENDGQDITYTGSWQQYDEGGQNYHYTSTSGDEMEFEFEGTNIYIPLIKGPDLGIASISVYKVSDSSLVYQDNAVDFYNASEITKQYKQGFYIHGLTTDDYKVVIENTGTKNASSTGYAINFDKALKYPSVEYIDIDNTLGQVIGYKALNYTAYGKVDITPNGDMSKSVYADLYSSGVTREYERVFHFLSYQNGSEPHRITIEASPLKNASSSNYWMSLEAFGKQAFAETEINTTELNLITLKGPDQGEMEVYVNNGGTSPLVKVTTLDLYHENYSIFAQSKITGLSGYNHKIRLVGTKDNDPSSNINIDAITGLNEAEFDFEAGDPLAPNDNVSLEVKAIGGPDHGKMKLYLDNVYKGTLDLYDTNIYPPKTVISTPIPGISPGSHTLKVVPAYEKHGESTGYKINIDELKLIKGDSFCSPSPTPSP